jgi:hypothetical protein
MLNEHIDTWPVFQEIHSIFIFVCLLDGTLLMYEREIIYA